MANSEATNPKYEKVREMFEQGHIPDFQTIFDIAPPTNVAKEINVNNMRLKTKIADPSLFKVKELRDIAALLKVDELSLFDLALRSIRSSEKTEEA